MSDFIPPELLIDILKWLSVEDLGRCLIVCKSWYSLITSPSFISLHTQIQSSPTNIHNNNRLLLVRSRPEGSDEEIYSIRFDNDTFEEYKSFNFPVKSSNMYFRVIGCFNGVVCLSAHFSDFINNIILWNPSIQKYVTLPELSLFGCLSHSIGFAFCADTNDFKVVRVFHPGDEDEDKEKYVDVVPPELEVYDLSKGCWRSVDPKGFPYIVDSRSPQAYLNGTVHWTGSSRSQRTGGIFSMIVSFDMGTEELGVIEMPDRVPRYVRHWRHFRVSVLWESLSLFHYFSGEGFKILCDVWVMKEYGKPESWSKLFNIVLDGGLQCAFGFRSNGQVLVMGTTKPWNTSEPSIGCKLGSYDPQSKQVKYLGINGDETSFCVDYFMGTLVLLGVGR